MWLFSHTFFLSKLPFSSSSFTLSTVSRVFTRWSNFKSDHEKFDEDQGQKKKTDLVVRAITVAWQVWFRVFYWYFFLLRRLVKEKKKETKGLVSCHASRWPSPTSIVFRVLPKHPAKIHTYVHQMFVILLFSACASPKRPEKACLLMCFMPVGYY